MAQPTKAKKEGASLGSLPFLHFKEGPFRKSLLGWYQKQNKILPWREDWKKFGDPYHVWVSEIMLQQTTLAVVIPKYKSFFKQFPTPKHLAKASTEELQSAVRGLGYYRRFRSMHESAKLIAGGRRVSWPKNYDEWLKLPGVGDYTASAVSSITLNEPHAVVDGNVERVFCRLFDIRKPSNDPMLKKEFKKLAMELLEKKSPGDYNQALMELGQDICTPTSPSCSLCPVKRSCKAHENESTHLAPAPKIKTEKVDVDLRILIPIKGLKIGLVERPEKAKFLKSTLGFVTLLNQNKELTQDGGSYAPSLGEEFANYTHNITKHRIKVKAYQVEPSKSMGSITWVSPEDADEKLISNLDRKALKRLMKIR